MFRKIASVLVLAALAMPAMAQAQVSHHPDRAPAAAKHKKTKVKKAKAKKAKKSKKAKKKAKKATHHAKAKNKRGTHAPNHDILGDGGPVSHTPPAEPAAGDDLPPPSVDGASQPE